MARPMRSWMFVPGNKQRFLDKCAELPVDCVILDLEDGVAPAAKDLARRQIRAAIEAGTITPVSYLRVSRYGTEWYAEDLSVVGPGLDGILLSKVEHVEEVTAASADLDRIEADQGMPAGQLKLVLAIESASGLLAAANLAASSARVSGLILGAEDLALDVGLSVLREGEARELLYARSAIVLAARASQVLAIDGVYPDYADLDGLREDARQARRLGFDGKSLFHPGQIEEINSVFSPTPEELAYAERVVAAFQAATERGDGAVAVGGQLVDLPIVRRAERLLEDTALQSGSSR